MEVWKAHYRDKLHDMDIEIVNSKDEHSEYFLSFEIDGIRFSGSSMFYFELADVKQYNKAKEKFNILKLGGKSVICKEIIDRPYYYALQRYEMDVEIPIKVLHICNKAETEETIKVGYEYIPYDGKRNQCIIECDGVRVWRDDVDVKYFELCINGEKYNSESKDSYFEIHLFEICKLIKEKYMLKCCFTCQYSDYSPYGNDDFGCMLCYRNNKEEYLKVNDKDDWFKYAEGLEFEKRQETFLCSEFEERTRCSGYRGFVDSELFDELVGTSEN